MRTFKEFLDEKMREGYPGTEQNPPDNIPWASTPTRQTKGEMNFPIPKKPVRLTKKARLQLPKHLQDHPDVWQSTGEKH